MVTRAGASSHGADRRCRRETCQDMDRSRRKSSHRWLPTMKPNSDSKHFGVSRKHSGVSRGSHPLHVIGATLLLVFGYESWQAAALSPVVPGGGNLHPGVPEHLSLYPSSMSGAHGADKILRSPGRIWEENAAPFSALQVSGGGDWPNQWADPMKRYDVSLNHRSGVRVDLGSIYDVEGSYYRAPAGRCPVFGKTIRTHQPTTDKELYPNDFLADIPTKDRRPLSGGFSLVTLPTTYPSKDIKALEKLMKDAVASLPSTDHRRVRLDGVTDPVDFCAAFVNGFAPSNDRGQVVSNYRWPFAFDLQTQKCYILYVAMQELKPAICSIGNASPKTWYCFEPQKVPERSKIVWGSGFVPKNWTENCPRFPIRDSQFGQWTGSRCIPLTPVGSKKVGSPEECGALVFDESPDDGPERHISTDSWNNPWGVIKNVFINATTSDSPHTSGFGINYATYYPDKTCYLHTASPNCLLPLKDGFAFTSVGSAMSAEAIGPPCPDDGSGNAACDCATLKTIGCIGNQWVNLEEDCTCDEGSINPWLIAGPILGILLLLFGGLGYYFFRRRRHKETKYAAAVAGTVSEASPAGGPKRGPAEVIQEADPSFWGEGRRESDATQVIIDTDYN